MFVQILPILVGALITYSILGVLKVAFTKRAAAVTRLATQPDSVIVLNRLTDLVLNTFLPYDDVNGWQDD